MSEWPPKYLNPVLDRVDEWSAWYAGDRASLERIGGGYGGSAYTGSAGATEKRFGTGPIGRVWRRFWGRQSRDASTEPTIKVHVPLAADIARASADLLFAEPPTLEAIEPEAPELEDGQALPVEFVLAQAAAAATTEQLQRFLDAGLIAHLAEAAEVGAALGGVYLRAAEYEGRVFVSRVDADQADPEFVFGKLTRVRFWNELPSENDRITLRHLEIHELDDQGNGVIRHELWSGSATDLGKPTPLTEATSLAHLLPRLDEDGVTIGTGSPGLDVVYVPTVTPAAIWRKTPAGRDLGVPHISGAEDLLDRLDHVYSSLMEEIDLAKARITVPEQWLTALGAGKGLSFDSDRRVFTSLSMPPTEGAKPELFQPDIRVDEHLRVMQQLTEDIIRRCGFAAATFGEDEDAQVTATGVNAKTARTRSTRNRMIRHWHPALVELLTKMLWMSKAAGADAKVDPKLVAVAFPQPQQTPLELAQTVALWTQAAAVSTWLKVRTLHPEWTDDQVQTEVDLILQESGAVVPDPEELGGAPVMDPEELRERSEVMGQMIRSGVEANSAARIAGLEGLEFTGAVPVTLRQPEKVADTLEQA